MSDPNPNPNPNPIQVFLRLFDSKTLTLHFHSHESLSTQSLKHRIQTLTLIPSDSLTLTLDGRSLSPSLPLNPSSLHLRTLTLHFPLLGGKGGFGSLLRGAATKAGHKKTNNFDACRDMSGRRLRHVNAEKRLQEWREGEDERRLERVAEEYLKKMEKKGKGGRKEDGANKYVDKYREESARCVEEVEKSVREMMAGKKRKVVERIKGKEKEGVDPKKIKIWMGKRKVDESDSDTSDDDEDSDVSDSENEKSTVIDNGHQSDSSKDGSSDSISVPQLNGGPHVSGSSDSGSEEEKETATRADPPSDSPVGDENEAGLVGMSLDTENNTINPTEKLSVSADLVSSNPAEIVTEKDPGEINSQQPSTSSLKEQDAPLSSDVPVPEGNGSLDCKSAPSGNGTTENSDVLDVSQPLNFDNYNSATELEVLGLERLKSELQARGLKCGGTLQERAARLFLLKTTPVEKLPKKLLAKK